MPERRGNGAKVSLSTAGRSPCQKTGPSPAATSSQRPPGRRSGRRGSSPAAKAAKAAEPARPVAVASRNGLAAVKLAVERMLAWRGPGRRRGRRRRDPRRRPRRRRGRLRRPAQRGRRGPARRRGDGRHDDAGRGRGRARAHQAPGRGGARGHAPTPPGSCWSAKAPSDSPALTGFPEENLLTERARKIWLYWKENASGEDDWLPDPKEVDDPDLRWFIEQYGDSDFRPAGTIHLSACAADGRLGCCTTTSGLFFKLSGRVGDSPLVGCGLYCDSEVGSAGGVGHGESCIISRRRPLPWSSSCGRASPPRPRASRPSSGWWATPGSPTSRTRRAARRTTSCLYAVNRAGEVGSAAIWSGEKSQYALCRAGSEPQLLDCAYLYKREPAKG